MATPEEICWLPLTELAPMIRRRKLSPIEVAEALLARIEALNPRLNAICTMHPERVRAAARVAEEAVVRGDDLGPLHGVPIAVKDLIFTDDHVTTGGSMFYRDFVPDEDDVTVAAHDVSLPGPASIGGMPVPGGGSAFSFTHAFNMTGSPAGMLAAGWTDDGLPIGLQIVGSHLADRLALRASRAFELAAPWADRRPAV